MQTNSSLPWFQLNDADQIDTPALLVYPDRVQQNINSAIAMTGSAARLRPHIKTHKTKEVAQMLIQAGVQQFKCATIAEAELLGMCKAKDVLLAYQPLGPKLDRFFSLIQHYADTNYACLVDNIAAALAMSEKAKKINRQLSVYIDLNVGMNRTGIVPENAMELIDFCLNDASLIVSGLHAYDGHLRNPDTEQRKQACDEAFARVNELQKQINITYQQLLPIIAGGSPSFPIHARREEVVCSPGTFVYWDYGYANAFPEQPFVHAALVITRIISLPAPGIICTDLGHKSIASENPIDKRVFFLNATDLTPVSQSEEHLVLKAPEKHAYKPGDILYGLPYHICPTCALYERAITVKDHQSAGEWMIAGRDRKINY
jgi:D-serine deaminase-like pyridoxal phosphate-dependent protein